MVPLYLQECRRCGENFPPQAMVNRCRNCGGAVGISYEYEAIRRTLNKRTLRKREVNLWRYWEMLPIALHRNIVTLGEGWTPVHSSRKLGNRIGLRNLYLKDETRLPTGSLKDRCATVSISKAVESRERSVVVSSSGNGAASMAAYASRAGVRCNVFVPSSIPQAKLLQSLAFGANVVRVRGTTGNAVRMAGEVGKKNGWPNLSTAATYNPYSMEGQKTGAYEIVEQLGWKVPDWVVVPVGSGNLLAGQWKGYVDLVELGLTDDLPRVAAVQADGCAPFTDAVKRGLNPSEVRPWRGATTIAAGVRDEFPYDVDLALPALRASTGVAVTVTDREILEAVKMLGRDEGVFSEPTGAVALAGVKILCQTRVIDKSESVVAMITGSGLKDLVALKTEFKQPQTIAPNSNSSVPLPWVEPGWSGTR